VALDRAPRGGRVGLAVTACSINRNFSFSGSVGGGRLETNAWLGLGVFAGANLEPHFRFACDCALGRMACAPSDGANVILCVGSWGGEGGHALRHLLAGCTSRQPTGGKTWKHIGLMDRRQIGAIIVDPRDAN